MKTYPDLVANITRVMNERGITADDLATAVAPAAVIEKTLRRQRYLDGWMLSRLAEALGVTVDDLKTEYEPD